MVDIKFLDNIAKIDWERTSRTGLPEVIFAEGKNPKDVAELGCKIASKLGKVIITRASSAHFYETKKLHTYNVRYYETARIIVIARDNYKVKSSSCKSDFKVGILCAGTSDIPIAEEARITVEELGYKTIYNYDVGIAGIHRLFKPLTQMLTAKVPVIIVVAGMEGTLPSIVKGLVDVPVIGVPTSTGYGYGGNGMSALMTMLQSCSPGLTVVNIDNGFGAGCAAVLIIQQCKRYIKNRKR